MWLLKYKIVPLAVTVLASVMKQFSFSEMWYKLLNSKSCSNPALAALAVLRYLLTVLLMHKADFYSFILFPRS